MAQKEDFTRREKSIEFGVRMIDNYLNEFYEGASRGKPDFDFLNVVRLHALNVYGLLASEMEELDVRGSSKYTSLKELNLSGDTIPDIKLAQNAIRAEIEKFYTATHTKRHLLARQARAYLSTIAGLIAKLFKSVNYTSASSSGTQNDGMWYTEAPSASQQQSKNHIRARFERAIRTGDLATINKLAPHM